MKTSDMDMQTTSIRGSKPMEAITSDLTTPAVEKSHTFSLSDITTQNYIIISVSSVSIAAILILIFVLIARRIRSRCCKNRKLFETYSSINYDNESIDEELDSCDNPAYSSCRLYVDSDFGVDSDVSEPEYDCMSVDSVVSVQASQSSSLEFSSTGVPSQYPHMSNITVQSLWKR